MLFALTATNRKTWFERVVKLVPQQGKQENTFAFGKNTQQNLLTFNEHEGDTILDMLIGMYGDNWFFELVSSNLIGC